MKRWAGYPPLINYFATMGRLLLEPFGISAGTFWKVGRVTKGFSMFQ